jgi:hypothetical protein
VGILFKGRDKFAKLYRPFLWPRKVPRKRFSLSMSWNWNIFMGTNTFEHAEFKSENFPHRRPAVFSQTAILSSLISQQINFFIVQRHGSMTTNDYVTQKDQFLLTSLPFNNYFELCNFKRVGRKQHNYLVYNFGKVPISLCKILSSGCISIKSQGRQC